EADAVALVGLLVVVVVVSRDDALTVLLIAGSLQLNTGDRCGDLDPRRRGPREPEHRREAPRHEDADRREREGEEHGTAGADGGVQLVGFLRHGRPVGSDTRLSRRSAGAASIAATRAC